MQPSIVQFKSIKLVGRKALLRKKKDQPNDLSAIPVLWQNLIQASAGLATRAGQERYVLIEGDLPHNQQDQVYYHAFIAVEDFTHVPDGWIQYEINDRKAAKFIHHGLPQTIGQTTARAIFEWLPQSDEILLDNSELFVYPEGYDRSNPNGHFDYYFMPIYQENTICYYKKRYNWCSSCCNRSPCRLYAVYQ